MIEALAESFFAAIIQLSMAAVICQEKVSLCYAFINFQDTDTWSTSGILFTCCEVRFHNVFEEEQHKRILLVLFLNRNQGHGKPLLEALLRLQELGVPQRSLGGRWRK